MKTFTLFVCFSIFSLAVFATAAPATSSRSPKVYIMMKHGKLIEVNHGVRKLVKKNVVLINLSTIHPNGAIDVSSGQSLQLKEGQYITMDGKIRLLKNMPAPAPVSASTSGH